MESAMPERNRMAGELNSLTADMDMVLGFGQMIKPATTFPKPKRHAEEILTLVSSIKAKRGEGGLEEMMKDLNYYMHLVDEVVKEFEKINFHF